MSFTQINNEILIRNDELSFTELGLYVYLASSKQPAFPSLATLQKRGLSKGTVLKCIRKLETMGFIEVIRSKGRCNKYLSKIAPTCVTPVQNRPRGCPNEDQVPVQNRPTNNTSINNTNLIITSEVDDSLNYEQLYNAYPGRNGRTAGLAKCRATIKDREAYNKLESAIVAYGEFCKNKGTGHEYIKSFSTFMDEWFKWAHQPKYERVKSDAPMPNRWTHEDKSQEGLAALLQDNNANGLVELMNLKKF